MGTEVIDRYLHESSDHLFQKNFLLLDFTDVAHPKFRYKNVTNTWELTL